MSYPGRTLVIAAFLAMPASAIAHGGGIDGYGCHHNRKAGGYHCHRGPLAGRAFGLQAEMLQQLKGASPAAPRQERAAPAEAAQTRTVVRVVDGDTIMLDGGERVRLIGVDTPETVHPQKPVERFGKQASEFTRRLLEGRRVRLEFDQQRRDHYSRTLAYVHLPDGRLANEEIIRQGYGHAFTKYPFAQEMMDRFRAAEREAREAGRGLWAP